MRNNEWNILVGVTDHEEGADLSTHLIKYGWNADHCYSAEEVMDTLLEGDYDLAILDDEIIADSEWSLEDLADSLPGLSRAIILGEAGSVYPLEAFGDRVRVLIRPFTYTLLHSLVELLLQDSEFSIDDNEVENEWFESDSDTNYTVDDFPELLMA